MFAVKKLSAPDVAVLRNETIEKFAIEEQYLHEYEGITGTQNFLNALCNYPILKNIQTNLFKCFLPQAWMINTTNGVSGFLHPEGVYDDSNGGRLRREIYSRLRDHLQFQNEQILFPIGDRETFSINIYGKSGDPEFNNISNVFAVKTIYQSFESYSSKPVEGIKNNEDQWNLEGHQDRIIRVTAEELQVFSELYDQPGTPYLEAKLPRIHSIQLISALEKFAAYPRRIGEIDGEYYPTGMWDETNAVKKDHTIRRNTLFPTNAEDLILSGPHFFVGNPYYKSPREICEEKADYDTIDLTVLPENYLQRTNYVPDCPIEEYKQRIPYAPWDISEDSLTHQKVIRKRVTDYYRIAYRAMLGIPNEHTLFASIIPKQCGHINGVQTTAFTKTSYLLSTAMFAYSIVADFYIKTTGKSNLHYLWATFPLLTQTPQLTLRVLCLSCLTKYYSELWQEGWEESFALNTWAKDDPRLPKDTFSKLTPEWTWETPLRTDYARRQALVEIDVLVARALGLTVDELCTIYRIQFPVLKQNENDTWYDQTGRIVFTCSKGLPGVGFDRAKWNEIKDLKAGDPCPTLPRNLEWLPEDQRGNVEPTITYYPPFDKCDREADYRTAWAYFDKLENK